MKRIFILSLLVMTLFGVHAQQSTTNLEITGKGAEKQKDKAFLNAYFQQTYDALARSVSGLSAEQFTSVIHHSVPPMATMGSSILQDTRPGIQDKLKL